MQLLHYEPAKNEPAKNNQENDRKQNYTVTKINEIRKAKKKHMK